MDPPHVRGRQAFPRLTADNHRVIGPVNPDYNCIHCAVGIDDVPWWPFGEFHYWPAGVPRELSVPAFASVLATRGLVPCSDPVLTGGTEKVALYALDDKPMHA